MVFARDLETISDSDRFYKEVAKNNQEVIDQFKSLIDSGIKKKLARDSKTQSSS